MRLIEARKIKRGRCLLFLLTAVLLSLSTAGCREEAEPPLEVPSVSASLLNERPLTIGDPIDVALIVYHGKNETVDFPDKTKSFDPFALKNTLVKRKKLKQGVTRTMIIYTLTIFQTGQYTLEPLTARVGSKLINTEPLEIAVLSVLPKDVENPPMKDIIPPYRARIRIWVPLVIGAALGGMAALLPWILKLLKTLFKKEAVVVHTEPVVDNYRDAREKLEQLRHDYREGKTAAKEAYSVISLALRGFIGSVLGLPALQMTTSEFSRELSRKRRRAAALPVPPSRIMQILRRSDLVKFAKEVQPPEKVEKDIDGSLSIVEEVHAAYCIETQLETRPEAYSQEVQADGV